MQMKEICEKTGLTDRAVRLYIENGLLSPAIESNYAGRRSIRFSEEDVEKKQRTLRILEELDCTAPMRYTDVASHLCTANAPDSIPKEDSLMRLKDLQTLIRRRIPSVIGFALLLIGTLSLTPMVCKAAFAEPLILVGGGYRLEYAFTGEAFAQNLLLFLLPLYLVAAAVLLFLHVLHGKRPFLTGAGILCVLFIIGAILLPEQLREGLYLYEFLLCRHSILWPFLPGTSAFTDAVIQSLKYIAPVGALICCAAGWFTQQKAD